MTWIDEIKAELTFAISQHPDLQNVSRKIEVKELHVDFANANVRMRVEVSHFNNSNEKIEYLANKEFHPNADSNKTVTINQIQMPKFLALWEASKTTLLPLIQQEVNINDGEGNFNS